MPNREKREAPMFGNSAAAAELGADGIKIGAACSCPVNGTVHRPFKVVAAIR
jgi:hypothetical protein